MKDMKDILAPSGSEVSIIPVIPGDGFMKIDEKDLPESLPILALRNAVLFPGVSHNDRPGQVHTAYRGRRKEQQLHRRRPAERHHGRRPEERRPLRVRYRGEDSQDPGDAGRDHNCDTAGVQEI